MDSVIILIVLTILAFGAAFSILPLQSRRERQDLLMNADEEWVACGFALSRGEFELYRIMPSPKWTIAEFVFEDESRRELGRYTTQTRYRGNIIFGANQATLYIQGSGLNRASFAGKLGAISNSSIVIRDNERVWAEVSRNFKNGELISEIQANGLTLTIHAPRFALFSRGTVFEGSRQVGQYRRHPGVSRKILVALDRKLPEELRVVVCCLTLLG